MGGDQCQNLHLFLFSTKVIYMVKFYMQMTHICMVKFYIQMVLSYLYGEGVHANDTLLFVW